MKTKEKTSKSDTKMEDGHSERSEYEADKQATVSQSAILLDHGWKKPKTQIWEMCRKRRENKRKKKGEGNRIWVLLKRQVFATAGHTDKRQKRGTSLSLSLCLTEITCKNDP